MNIIKAKQLEFSLDYVSRVFLNQSNKIAWLFNDDLVTLNTFEYENERYPILNKTLKGFDVDKDISYLNDGKDEIFSLIRRDLIKEIQMEFGLQDKLKANPDILLKTIIETVDACYPNQKELEKFDEKLDIDTIYNIHYLNNSIPDLDFMMIDSNSEFEPISIISTLEN